MKRTSAACAALISISASNIMKRLASYITATSLIALSACQGDSNSLDTEIGATRAPIAQRVDDTLIETDRGDNWLSYGRDHSEQRFSPLNDINDGNIDNLGIAWSYPLPDARSLVASLAMGAEGMNMGTRFLATKEAPVHENVKQAILNATELDTRLVMRPLRNTERVLTNEAVERLLEKERALGSDIKFEDIANEVAGVYPRIMQQGEMEAGAWSCGMVAGLINDIPSCAELIERIMREADALIAQRLEGLRSGAAVSA